MARLRYTRCSAACKVVWQVVVVLLSKVVHVTATILLLDLCEMFYLSLQQTWDKFLLDNHVVFNLIYDYLSHFCKLR